MDIIHTLNTEYRSLRERILTKQLQLHLVYVSATRLRQSNTTAIKTTPFARERKKELPWVGFVPTTLCSLGEYTLVAGCYVTHSHLQ